MSQAVLHQLFLDIVLDPGAAEAFNQDPRAFAAARGLGKADQDALAKNQRRLGVYRSLVRGSLRESLPNCFPILHRLLAAEDLWHDLETAFIASRSVRSLYYRDITPTFLGWLLETRPHLERWPFLLQLAHFEYMELEIVRWPDPLRPAGLQAEPAPERTVVLDDALRNLAYDWRVHLVDEDAPVPDEGPAFLCCLRNAHGHFECLEQTPAASAFLARCLDDEPLGSAAAALGFPWQDALNLLQELQERGAVLGYRG